MSFSTAVRFVLSMKALWFIAIAVFIILLQGWLHKRLIFQNLDVRRAISPQALFAGDSAILEITVSNRKLYPVLMLEVRQLLPASFFIEYDESFLRSEARYEYSFRVSVLPFQTVRRKYRVKLTRRGYYELNNEIVLVSSDIFGAGEYSAGIKAPVSVFVYPRITETEGCLLPSGLLQGDFFVRRWILDDPSAFAGIREYTGTEELRRINWKAAARSGSLKVNVPDFTSDRKVIVLFYLENTESEAEGTAGRYAEKALEYAASITVRLVREGIPAGMATNALVLPDSDMQIVLPGSGDLQITNLLDAFAGVTGYKRVMFDEIVRIIEHEAGRDIELLIIPSESGAGVPELFADSCFQKTAVIIPEGQNAVYPERVTVINSRIGDEPT